MGYSKSIKAVKRVQPILDTLVKAEGAVEWPSNNPAADSYAIRDGIRAAGHFAVTEERTPREPYYTYANLLNKFTIKSAAGKVIAAPRDAVPLLALRESHSTMFLPDITEEFGIVGAAMTHRAEKMHFPDADPETVDLESVYNWAQSEGYFVIVNEEAGVTLTKADPGALAWTPQ